MPKLTQQFQTIRTEGALLPSDILQRIASLKVDGIRPADYHLPEGFRVNEAVTQSWDILKKHWKNFQEARQNLPAEEHGTALTNERWLLPLFKELEYGRLSVVPSPQIEDRTYPIERFYNHTPIHMIGCNLPLDKRTKGARGAATSGPHSMMQEFLNRSDTHLWGFLSNGLQLRVLRDSVALSRQAYVEFDLEGMMDGEVYGDFVLMWLLCHQSRVEAERPENCWLEQWSKLAREEGTRVLNNLRTGVTRAIEALGQGFIAHPQNHELRSKLQESGSLTKDDFYRQLLRTVYRLLFLFVAEDRELLHPPETGEQACKLYDIYYSTRRLREMAFKLRGSKHADLWHSLSLVFGALDRDLGLPELGLPGLGSFLWQNKSTPDILGPSQVIQAPFAPVPEGEGLGVSVEHQQCPVFISNDDLLSAIRAIAYVEQDKVLRSVDYRNMGTEEFGSVYESLLELHPVIHVEAKTFSLNTAAGNERKTSGSYYTPDSLVQCLLDSALDPVVEESLKGKRGKEAEDAILSLKVCDPACGSGHFLIAAAHRLARHLARVRTGESEPSPSDFQHALRDVIGRCIYGVDINPMAVELCKVSLWMEALEPGKPLSFLDYHIQVGNSLIGATPALLQKGIPDDAFTPIEGDVKAKVAILKKQNKKEREDRKSGQKLLGDPLIRLGNLAAEFARITSAADGTIADITALQEQYSRLITSSGYASTRLLADTWCAAFVWKKDDSDLGKMCPTELDFRKVESHAGAGLLPHVRAEVERLRDQYQFFHWHLAFPDVFRLPGKGEPLTNSPAGWSGGFHVVLGNPPWERVKLQKEEWFAAIGRLDIAKASNAAVRDKMIRALEFGDAHLFAEFSEAIRIANAESIFFRGSTLYPLSGVGDVNTFAIFTELATKTVDAHGLLGIIVPTGIATDDQLKEFFSTLIDRERLVSLVGFENEEFFFPGIANVVRYCAICISGTGRRNARPQFAFYIRNAAQIDQKERYFTLTRDQIARLNPNTRTCPIFRTEFDSTLTLRLYERFPILRASDGAHNSWSLSFQGMFHMANDSGLFHSRPEGKVLPLYEAKLFWHYDHRFGSYEFKGVLKGKGGRGLPDMPIEKHQDPNYSIVPQYWVNEKEVDQRLSSVWSHKWLLAYRTTSSAKLERTLVASVIPRTAVNHKAPLFIFGSDTSNKCHLFLAIFNSIVLDYVSRQKIGGTDVGYFHIDQLPFPAPADFTADDDHFIRPRVLELTYTANDVQFFARDLGWLGNPFKWNPERRLRIQCELDAYIAHFFGLTRSEFLFILDPQDLHGPNYCGESFRVMKEKENELFGEFRTKRLCLECFDALSQARQSGTSYESSLVPEPGSLDAAW